MIKKLLKKFVSFVVIVIATNVITEFLGHSATSLIKSLPKNFFTAFMNNIAKDLPDYQMHSTPHFAASVIVIILGSFIVFLLMEVASTLDESMPEESEEQVEDLPIESKKLFKISISSDIFSSATSKVIFLEKVLLAFLFIIYIVFHASYVKSLFVYSTGVETLNKIEIISPYVSDLEYKQMKSDFYRIDTWNDYDQLDKRLNAIMEAEGISVTNK